MSLARLRAEVTPRELAQWMAYARIEPIGEQRADLRTAFMTFNIVRALVTKECSDKLKVTDFMLDFSGEPGEAQHEQTDEEQAAILAVMAMAMGPPVIE
jgi:hypothetical protein